jgi:arylsulfatase A-like enzyme
MPRSRKFVRDPQIDMERPRPLQRAVLAACLVVAAACARGRDLPPPRAETGGPPNIVLILADDLGYGDLGCYGATKVRTPNIDRFAEEGIRFTDAHSASAVCTPSRYALLTGREFWHRRSRWQGGSLLQEVEVTLPSLLHSAGYATACIGKWHLGFGEQTPDWNGELKPGPLEAGFDYFFGTPNTHNEPPMVLVENHHVIGLSPSDPIEIVPSVNPDEQFGTMHGGNAARFHDEELATLQTAKAVKFMEEHADRPFFLYFATNNVHGPLVPSPRFKGKSQSGEYGDFIEELDWSVGQVLETLERLHQTKNTLVIFSSDNGAVLFRSAIQAGHHANGALLGQKTDAWEGGHRVPFVARWPEHIPRGACSGEMISLSDMLATTAAILGRELPPDAGPDSFNVLPALLNEPGHAPAREVLTMAGIRGLAIREGNWFFFPEQGSGGMSAEPVKEGATDTGWWMKFHELGWTNNDFAEDGSLKPDAPPGQLYDLAADPCEKTNVYREHPDVVARLTEKLAAFRKAGRTRP